MVGLPVPCVRLLAERPSSRRCLFTVRAAISVARAGSMPRSSSLSFTCSYNRSSLLLQPLGMAASCLALSLRIQNLRPELPIPCHTGSRRGPPSRPWCLKDGWHVYPDRSADRLASAVIRPSRRLQRRNARTLREAAQEQLHPRWDLRNLALG